LPDGIHGRRADAVYIHGTAESEQGRLAALNRLTNQSFVDFLELKRNDSVLEVGSGLGMLAAEVAARAPHGEVVGVEYSAEQLAATKVTQSNLRFQQGDALRLPFEADRFDVVYCVTSRTRRRPAQALAEMHRVLRRNGKVFIQENNILANEFYPDCPSSTLFGENSQDFNDSSAATL